MSKSAAQIQVSVVIPCLNEEKTIAECVRKALLGFQKLGVRGEVVVADNGSTDNSVAIAKKAGARVVHQTLKGYGNAYHKGFAEAKGKYLVMGDADDTYDFSTLEPFIKPLQAGEAEFVIGNRLVGVQPGAMPWLHRYVGTPVLATMLKIMFGGDIHDNNCGMRAFTREAYDRLKLQTTGMEYASEMVIKAIERKVRIKEVPIIYYARPDGSESKLKTFRDGWRHLRFMLLHSPLHLFLIPGLVLFLLGIFMMTALAAGTVMISGFSFDVPTLALGCVFTIIGYEIITLGFYTMYYRVSDHWSAEEEAEESLLERLHGYLTLERGILIGVLVALAGAGLEAYVFWSWFKGGQPTVHSARLSLIALTLFVLGVQTVFSSFFLSILRIERRS
jgi:glycosyltransferase involved in cell wall biosynthesis